MKQGLQQTNVFVINSMAGETVPLLAGTTSTNVAFALPASALNYDVIVTNTGSNVAFVNFGPTSATVAQLPGTTGTLGATPIPPGQTYTLQKNSDAIKSAYCAGITATGTAQLYFTSIQGS